MKKIPTLYLRDFDGDPKYVTSEANPECAWVFAGEGIATRKYDGTCVLYDDIRWWARREVKPGKAIPPDFLLADHDEKTGKSMGWEPIEQSSFAKYHAEAIKEDGPRARYATGTYELIGPKINGNPEKWHRHLLIRHQDAEPVVVLLNVDFELIASQLRVLHSKEGAEGVVWHHPDGRMAKLKARDFPAPRLSESGQPR